ncbi:MAG: nucleotidyltransferase domain-containing protein [Cyanobacteria bacterium P01_D01_bin.44]
MSPSPAILNTVPNSSEQRRQIALAVAEQCTQLLKQKFGAIEVIVFGSLRGDTPWHNDSDLDLAVRGVSPEVLLEAYQRLEKVVPSWLPFDLVAIEQADQRICDRILQRIPMPKNKYLALKVRLEDELSAIEKTIDTLNAALAQADTVAEIFVTPTLAAYIEDFYSGCERLAERVAVTLDDGLPDGRNWHEQLLRQMAEPGSQGRPPLWERSLLLDLDGYRRFRHRARHLYNLDLDGQRVVGFAQQVPTVFSQVQQAVKAFSEWLEKQD